MPIMYDIETDGLYLKGLAIGEKKGIEQGIEQGEAKRLKNIVLNGLKKNWSYEDIAEITELSVEAIRKIDEEREK